MPIYEYRCSHCRRSFSFLVRNVAAHRVPACPRCAHRALVRSLSRFAAPASGRSGGEPGPAGDETDDPRVLGRMMRDMAGQTGEPVEPEMDEMIRRLESGEDPEAIENQMGEDGPGPVPGGDDTLYDG
jgi:putative FmdB family regulatory protein